ncbi:matrix metalloproteinase-27-like [Paroedura picta]|uniref:matrix metalloproteinase-27-like n=1 Tax=Paroedura picta TaxID=143630 RepID=UPI0040574BFB
MKSSPLFLLLSVRFSYAFPTHPGIRSEEQSGQRVQEYLEQFYELEHQPKPLAWKRGNSLEGKIRQMQEFFHLNVTGKTDADTLAVMQQPRCGMPDIASFVLALPGWSKTKLTYRILNYTPDMKTADVDRAIERAFEVWSDVSPLTFTRIHQGAADLKIAFATGVHGRCPQPFWGALPALAHAFPPGYPFRGNVHFNEDYNWAADSDTEVNHARYTMRFNLFLVAAHEIGHALGLAHSNDPKALMFPYFKSTLSVDFPLTQDDIDGIQAIYGPSPHPPKEPAKPTLPKACDPKTSFDAITTMRQEVMFLKGRHYWRVYPRLSEVDYELISTFWPSLPSGIQAAYENMNDQVLFFKDNHFWVLSGLQMEPGYPRTIDHLHFPRDVKKIDAAALDKNTGKTYFFVGNQYWRYDEQSQSMDRGYPRKTREDFPGIGPKVDAAFQHNGFFYFFHKSKQWEFDLNDKRVTRVMKSNSWLNC